MVHHIRVPTHHPLEELAQSFDAAQELDAAVLLYDRDYDTLANPMGFESVWLAPAGTLP